MSTVNAPTNLTKVADLGAAYTLNSPNVIITRPDGTTYTAIATVSPSVSTSANPHMFNALFVPTMGGLYKARFQAIVAGQTLNFPFNFWASWNDIYTDVRNMLGVSAKSLPDSRLDFIIASLVTNITNFATLNPYYLFTTTPTNYQLGFDQGLTFLLAAKVRPFIGGKRPTGEVSLMKKGNTTVQYSVGSPKMEFTLEQQWWEHGMSVLQANIPEIEAAMEADRYGDETMDRGDLATGNYFPKAGWQVLQGGGSSLAQNPFFSSVDGGGNEF